MAHIGFVFPPVPGHMNANATLARALVRRGHRVTVFHIPPARTVIEAQQLSFQPVCEDDANTRALAASVDRLGALTGLRALRFTVRCGAALTRILCEHAPAAIRTANVDLLVVDQNEPAGGSVAQHLRLPFVNVAFLPLNREPQMPPPFVPWGHDGRLWTTLRNQLAYAIFDRLIAPVNRVLNEYRGRWNLPLVRRPDDTFSDVAQLSQLTEDFDFPRQQKPASLHYLGPFFDDSRPPVSFPYERLSGKPLVYASFGTLLKRKDLLEMIAIACADLDVQLVLSARGEAAMHPDRFAGAPIVVEQAPQLELLRRAAVCITHAGLNTVMESLTFGVPMVALPITNDQPAVAARVGRVGAGEVISPGRATAARLRSAIERVLREPGYRQAAGKMRNSIAQAGGVDRAADIIETVLRRQ